MSAARCHRGRHREQRARGAGSETQDEKQHIFGEHHRGQMPMLISHRPEERQFSATFPHAAQQHHGQTERAEEQTKPTERLNRPMSWNGVSPTPELSSSRVKFSV